MKTSSRTIYMLSGFDKENGFYETQEKYLKSDVKNNSNITFIASSFDNYSKTDKHVNILLNSFAKINIKFRNSYLIDYRISIKEARDFIKKSHIIFIMGGDTYKEFEHIKEYNLIDSIKQFDGIIIGVSAGSLNMSKKVCYLDEYRDYSLVEYEGINITDINIYPHFDIDDKDFVNETLEVSKKVKLFALPNKSFIRIHNKKTEIIGKYYLIENKKIIKGIK